jgi:phage repressor protein C with HTH and peptisase S24 domain
MLSKITSAKMKERIAQNRHTITSAAKLMGMTRQNLTKHLSKEFVSLSFLRLMEETFPLTTKVTHYPASEAKASQVNEPREIYINLDASGNKPIPIIDIQAAAGYPSEIGNPVFLQNCPTVSITWPQFKNGEHVMMEIKGNSMEDTIYHGDWVICRRLFNPVEEIKDGYIHVVVTGNKEGGEVVCKRVLNRLASKKHLVLQSDNPEFITYIEPMENILQVWKVEFKMSAILKNKNTDLYKRMNNLEAEISDIRRMLKK